MLLPELPWMVTQHDAPQHSKGWGTQFTWHDQAKLFPLYLLVSSLMRNKNGAMATETKRILSPLHLSSNR